MIDDDLCGIWFWFRSSIAVNRRMTPEELKGRTKRFALDVLRLCDSIPRTISGRAIANQLVRAGTSVAANYRAACLARSRADFGAKIGIVLEEADESAFWLELLSDSKMLQSAELARLQREALEIKSIMYASRKKVCERRF